MKMPSVLFHFVKIKDNLKLFGVNSNQLWKKRKIISLLYFGLIAVGLLSLDYITGPLSLIPFFYVILVSLVAWFVGPRISYVLAVLLPLLRILSLLWNSPWAISNSAVNLIIQMISLFVVIYLTTIIKKLAQELRTLKGDLPICYYCSNIRNERGEWEQIESYVSRQSEIRFTHDICPECSEKIFGKLLNNRKVQANIF